MIRVPSECCLCLKQEAATAHATALRVSVSWFYWCRFFDVYLESMRICPSFVHWMLTDWRADGGTILQGSFAVCPDRISSKDEPDRSILNLRETEGRWQCFYFIYSVAHLIWIREEIKQAHWCLSISSGVFTGGQMVLPYRGTGPSLGSRVGAGWDDPSTTQTQHLPQQCRVSVSCVKTC